MAVGCVTLLIRWCAHNFFLFFSLLFAYFFPFTFPENSCNLISYGNGREVRCERDRNTWLDTPWPMDQFFMHAGFLFLFLFLFSVPMHQSQNALVPPILNAKSRDIHFEWKMIDWVSTIPFKKKMHSAPSVNQWRNDVPCRHANRAKNYPSNMEVRQANIQNGFILGTMNVKARTWPWPIY